MANQYCAKCLEVPEICEECLAAAYDARSYSTSDILADLPGLLATFGPEDELVQAFQMELARR